MTDNNAAMPKLRLKPGLHAITAVSLRAGNGRTSAILSTACVCKLLGLPAVVLNLEMNSNMLEKNLPENTIITTDASNAASMLKSIIKAEKHARETDSLLLIDLPSAWEANYSGMALLRQSGFLNRCDSLMVIAALVPNAEGVVCATEGLAAFQPASKVLIRVMRDNVGENLPVDQWRALANYPVWECKNWTPTTVAILSRNRTPQLPPLAEYRSRLVDGSLNNIEHFYLKDVIDSIETSARGPIYDHLLAHITEALK